MKAYKASAVDGWFETLRRSSFRFFVFVFFFGVIFTPIPVGRTYSSIQWRHPTSLFPKKSLRFHFCLLFHSWRFVCHKNPWFWLKRKGLSRVFIRCWKLQGCIPTAHHSMGPILGEAKNATVWICMVVLRDLPPKIMPYTLFRMEIPTNDPREVTTTSHPRRRCASTTRP